jgi:uncharacterized LabA/DUF88 family protein
MKNYKNYAFIDSQNLNLAIQDLGWKLDFKKFRVFLQDKYKVAKAYLFIGHIAENETMYTALKDAGYEIIYKPTLEKNGIVKGNCDAELVLQCMIEYKNFDKAVIVSGDGDFHCLIEYLDQKKKLLAIGIPSKKHFSSLLRGYAKYFFYVSDYRNKLRYGGPRSSRPDKSSKPEVKPPVKKTFSLKRTVRKTHTKNGEHSFRHRHLG